MSESDKDWVIRDYNFILSRKNLVEIRRLNDEARRPNIIIVRLMIAHGIAMIDALEEAYDKIESFEAALGADQ